MGMLVWREIVCIISNCRWFFSFISNSKISVYLKPHTAI